MLTRTELMEPSIRTFSFSFLLMVTGCNRSSLLLLKTQCHKGSVLENRMLRGTPHRSWNHFLRPESKEQETHKQGCSKMGASGCTLQWSQGKEVLKSSLLCYFPWVSYPIGISIFSSIKWLTPISLARTERKKGVKCPIACRAHSRRTALTLIQSNSHTI